MRERVANHYHMTAADRVKARTAAQRLVGVIASEGDLTRAIRSRRHPELFELRLDALHHCLADVDVMIQRLRPTLVVTCRHAREGAIAELSDQRRSRLLLQFLDRATYVDLELRSLRVLRAVDDEARARGTQRIVSVHEFARMPAPRVLEEWARRAEAVSPDVFKLVLRTETEGDLAQLRAFFERESERLPLSVMGVGRLGRKSRRMFARLGSILNYAHLGAAQVEGQLSLAEMRRVLGSGIKSAAIGHSCSAELPQSQAAT